MKKSLLLGLALAGQAFAAQATDYIPWVDWDQIQHWAGDPDGDRKCALVIDFQDGNGEESLVWGYRWSGTATGEDLVRAVASQSSILTAMIQYTGSMGSTLNALGVSANREELDVLHYDFDRAAIGGEVSFGYFDPNITMGQETAPGYDAEQMCADAIVRAKDSGIIEHPLNAFFYGYPAYDYDYWQLEDGYADSMEYRWRSGWYDGYWSYWHGPNDYDYMGYSGLGMSSTVLTDGCVQAWKYITFNGEGIGAQGGELAEALDYSMDYWGEEMHEAATPVQPVDQSKVNFWVGEGEKAATVVFQFNDGRGPENLVYGYRWTGGWDDNLMKVLQTISEADPRMNLSENGSDIAITYDSNHDGTISGNYDHTDVADTWNFYVKRTVDENFNKVNSGRWLNPNAVMIVSHQPAETASVALPYRLYRPAMDSEVIITAPAEIDYALADQHLQVPLFIQIPAGGKMSTAYNWLKDELPTISTATVTSLMGQVTAYSNFAPAEGTIRIRGSYTAPGASKAEYITSNEVHITLRNPERPVTGISYARATVDTRLNHPVDNELVIVPADATYTKMTYTSSNTKAATVASTGVVTTTKTPGEADITATYALNPSLTAGYALTSSLQNPVQDITFEAVGPDGVLTLTPKQMTGLFPVFSPADPDITDVTVTLSDNGSARENYIATMYKVNLWDEKKTRTTPYELSGHRVGECKLTVAAADGTGFSKEITVRVVEPERDKAIDYTTGTIMLNEEWFGHTNGGLNWFSPTYDVVYQAYERENPGMSFGCTSQYGIIHGGKLIVSSKQAADGGDPLPGGGRLVIADAATLKRIGSIDDIMVEGESKSSDGRALCGAGPGKVYFGTSNGIYIIDTDACAITGKIAMPGENSTDLYSGQMGDMVLAGHHVFAIKQSTGVIVIDIDTDQIVKEVADANVQGITQAGDGRVWYATTADGHSVFVALDHQTLEESERVDVPSEFGVVTCGWGAWRTTQFTGAHSVNSLFFSGGSSIANGGDGKYCRYDIDTETFRRIATVSGLPAHTPTYVQGAYGTIRYDDRSGEIIAGTTESNASGHYRYNWTHFIDAETGTFNRSIELRPYYWFQSMPIFPDVYGPEIETVGDIELTLGDEPVEVTLKASDRDNNDANIRYSLLQAPAHPARAADGAPVEVSLEGNKLTINPVALGNHTIGLEIESNGRKVQHAVNVSVRELTALDTPGTMQPDASLDGRVLTVSGCAGAAFELVNAAGVVVDAFYVDAEVFTHSIDLAAGIYILVGDNSFTRKLIIR